MSGCPPENLILSTIEGFQISPDVITIEKTSEEHKRLNRIRQEKQARLEAEVEALEKELRDTLAGLDKLEHPTSEILEQLNLDNSFIDSRVNNGTVDVETLIDERAAALDLEKISLAKQLSEIETTLVQLKAAETSLDEQLADLEQQKKVVLAPGKKVVLHPTPMKIMFFKKLGMHIDDADAENENSTDTILVHTEAGDSAKVLNVESKFSDFFISSFIWNNVDKDDE